MTSETIIIILLSLLIAYILFFNKSDCDKDKNVDRTKVTTTKFSWFKPTIPNHLATRFQQPNPISGNEPSFNPMATPTKFQQMNNPISGNDPAFNPMATPTKFSNPISGNEPSFNPMATVPTTFYNSNNPDCPIVDPCPRTICPKPLPCPKKVPCFPCSDCTKLTNELNTKLNSLMNDNNILTKRLQDLQSKIPPSFVPSPPFVPNPPKITTATMFTGHAPPNQVMPNLPPPPNRECNQPEPCVVTTCPKVNPCPSVSCPVCPDCNLITQNLQNSINKLSIMNNDLQEKIKNVLNLVPKQMMAPSPIPPLPNLSKLQNSSKAPALATMFSNNIVRHDLATFSYPLSFATKGSKVTM